MTCRRVHVAVAHIIIHVYMCLKKNKNVPLCLLFSKYFLKRLRCLGYHKNEPYPMLMTISYYSERQVST